jgi:hypothetical protein
MHNRFGSSFQQHRAAQSATAKSTLQAVEKRPSAALRSSCFTAAYKKYASFLMISQALHPSIFEQPSPIDFFNTLLTQSIRS